jgi:hypothetical protein
MYLLRSEGIYLLGVKYYKQSNTATGFTCMMAYVYNVYEVVTTFCWVSTRTWTTVYLYVKEYKQWGFGIHVRDGLYPLGNILYH